MNAGVAARVVVGALAASFILTGIAQDLRPLPPVMRTITDEVGVLSAGEGSRLSQSLQEVLEVTGVRIALVITETTSPEFIDDYAERLAQRWERDRGVDSERMVFVIVAMHDREMEVLPGISLGISQALLDADVTGGLDVYFREKRHFQGLQILISRIRKVIVKKSP